MECKNDGVRIAIDAPRHISVLREELSEHRAAEMLDAIRRIESADIG